MNRQMGARLWLAHTQCDYARLLLVGKQRGDRERARERIDGAIATYRELGMDAWTANAAQLLT
jgi:hypothetical protein